MTFEEWFKENWMSLDALNPYRLCEAAWNAAIASQAAPSQEHSEHYWRHEVNNAFAEGYQKGRESAKKEAAPSQEPTLVRFNKAGGMEEPDPVERLRFFCSLAMKPQDWLDVAQFFDAIKPAPSQEPRAEDIEWAIPAPDICFDPDNGAEGWAYSYDLLEHTLNINRQATPSQELTDNDILIEVAGNPLANGQDAIDFARAVLAAAKRKAAPSQDAVKFLCNGTRYKVSRDAYHGTGSQILGLPNELNGEWVALVEATDNCHMKLTTPPDAAAQIKKLTTLCDGWRKEAIAMERQIAKLEAALKVADDSRNYTNELLAQQAEKLAAAEKDAARYRFIRSNRFGEKLARTYAEYSGGDRLDAAIDETMSAMKLSPGDTAKGGSDE